MIYAIYFIPQMLQVTTHSLFFIRFHSHNHFVVVLNTCRIKPFLGLKSKHFMWGSDCSLLCIKDVRDWCTGYQRAERVRHPQQQKSRQCIGTYWNNPVCRCLKVLNSWDPGIRLWHWDLNIYIYTYIYIYIYIYVYIYIYIYIYI